LTLCRGPLRAADLAEVIMLVWILRATALLGSPVLAYYFISPDWKGVLAGAISGEIK